MDHNLNNDWGIPFFSLCNKADKASQAADLWLLNCQVPRVGERLKRG